ncbi:hypothetical protein RSOLAG1IB_05407 [Rhizoctonia solani AG-1 IB]|uniref:Uncharacterized protein n=1 Tax=Thanatephorus cucumeris (strain AG1-IB / isolate 7/3/14) TaxID=1108050 RepID=A0A0B7G4H7_THACB|nr:hypothetical protein RSOLAG1IB_05407 [Rhizoctonia solani AG-1 IB]
MSVVALSPVRSRIVAFVASWSRTCLSAGCGECSRTSSQCLPARFRALVDTHRVSTGRRASILRHRGKERSMDRSRG